MLYPEMTVTGFVNCFSVQSDGHALETAYDESFGGIVKCVSSNVPIPALYCFRFGV